MSLSPSSAMLACLYGSGTVCIWNFPEITLVTYYKSIQNLTKIFKYIHSGRSNWVKTSMFLV